MPTDGWRSRLRPQPWLPEVTATAQGGALPLALVLMVACGGGQRTGAADATRLDLTKLPPDIAQAYPVFAAHCSRCHSLGRPINAPVTDVTHWDRYVQRMMKVPGSGINPKEAKIILRFLHYYTTEIRNREEPEPMAPSAPIESSILVPRRTNPDRLAPAPAPAGGVVAPKAGKRAFRDREASYDDACVVAIVEPQPRTNGGKAPRRSDEAQQGSFT